jgi:hypothetical protein
MIPLNLTILPETLILSSFGSNRCPIETNYQKFPQIYLGHSAKNFQYASLRSLLRMIRNCDKNLAVVFE